MDLFLFVELGKQVVSSISLSVFLVGVCYCIAAFLCVVAASDPTDEEVAESNKTKEELLSDIQDNNLTALWSYKYRIAVIALIIAAGGVVLNSPEALIQANKNRLIYHYTSEEVVQEQVEPLIEEFVRGLSNIGSE